MSMNTDITHFISRVKSMSENNGLASGIYGTNRHQSVMDDLYRAATKLKAARNTTQVDEQLDEIVGVLNVAQVMNVIGSDDLEELMDILDKIKTEEK